MLIGTCSNGPSERQSYAHCIYTTVRALLHFGLNLDGAPASRPIELALWSSEMSKLQCIVAADPVVSGGAVCKLVLYSREKWSSLPDTWPIYNRTPHLRNLHRRHLSDPTRPGPGTMPGILQVTETSVRSRLFAYALAAEFLGTSPSLTGILLGLGLMSTACPKLHHRLVDSAVLRRCTVLIYCLLDPPPKNVWLSNIPRNCTSFASNSRKLIKATVWQGRWSETAESDD